MGLVVKVVVVAVVGSITVTKQTISIDATSAFDIANIRIDTNVYVLFLHVFLENSGRQTMMDGRQPRRQKIIASYLKD